MHSFRAQSLVLAALLAIVTTSAHAQVVLPTTDFSDDTRDFAAEPVVDLSLAATGTWDATSPTPGNGIYDPDKWAIVFKYTSITIPTGTTVTFTNHPSGAPVVWLVEGDVTIESGAELNLDGGYGASGLTQPTPGGPGGFRGGTRELSATVLSGAGLGPAGGPYTPTPFDGRAAAGGYATLGGIPSGAGYTATTYGNPQIVPLIGGSGGAGSTHFNYSNGGGGGGAILIAAQGTITVDGLIRAKGGSTQSRGGGGAGGAIRLLSETLAGAGTLDVTGGSPGVVGHTGGNGRIRLETNTPTHALSTVPRTTDYPPDSPVLIWPASNAPTVTITGVGGSTPPAEPGAGVISPDITLVGVSSFTISLQTVNADPAATVTVKLVRKHGQDEIITATLDPPGQTGPILNWITPGVSPGDGFGVVQARVIQP